MMKTEKSPFEKKGKQKRIAKQVEIILDMFGGTLVEGGKNEKNL